MGGYYHSEIVLLLSIVVQLPDMWLYITSVILVVNNLVVTLNHAIETMGY